MVTGWIVMIKMALAATPVSVGQHALTFSLPVVNTEEDAEARRIALASYVGMIPRDPQKAVLVYFFSRREGSEHLETLNRLQRRYDSQGLQVLAISTDVGSVGGLAAWLQEQTLDYPVLRDNHQIVQSRYGFDDMPIAVIIDSQGYIFAVGKPDAGDFGTDLEAELNPLLARPASTDAN